MILKSLSIVNLHGVLSLDVEFNKDTSLLVGINGSGKTSVLNVIDWLLRPDMQRLAIAQYDALSLRFLENNAHYELSAKKSSAKLVLSISGGPKQLTQSQ